MLWEKVLKVMSFCKNDIKNCRSIRMYYMKYKNKLRK